MKKLVFVFLPVVLSLTLCSCSLFMGDKEEETPTPQATQVTQVRPSIPKQSLKIQTVVEDRTTNPSRMATIEWYVDGDGNGEGLFGYGDRVIDVIVASDKLYLALDETHIVSLADITGHGYFTNLDISSPESAGFTMADGVPVKFSGSVGNLLVDTKYGSSANTYSERQVSASSELSFQDAFVYIIDFYTDVLPLDGSVGSDGEHRAPVESFYIGDDYGVTIEGMVYSIGDTISYNSYFQGSVPEGILQSYRYKEDSRVDFYHVSYISSSGRTVFTSASNYVQGIETSAEFEWRGIKSGTEEKELRNFLGYKVTQKDLDAGVVIADENIIIDDYKSNTFFCHVGKLKAELRLTKGILTEIYLYQDLGF